MFYSGYVAQNMNHFYHIDFDQIKLNRDSFTALIFHRIQQNIIKGDDSSFAVVAEVCGVPFGPAASAIRYGTAVGGFINSSRSSNVTLYSFHLYYIPFCFYLAAVVVVVVFSDDVVERLIICAALRSSPTLKRKSALRG